MNRFHRWFCKSDGWRRRLESEILPWAIGSVELGANVLEVGPGPGVTTDMLRERFASLTCIEIDPRLAGSLKQRMKGSNVTVVEGDATRMPFEPETFSGAVSFTMLHHVPSAELQDRLLKEVYRVLKPGAIFAGTDSRWSRMFQLIHLWDTMTVIDPEGFVGRLEAAGFQDVKVTTAERAFRFRARRGD